MSDIKNKKLLYHLTSLNNVPAILDQGLLPRSQVRRFRDVADKEILKDREILGLEHKVPFHFFAGNPFDGRVQKDHPDEDFVLFTVHRDIAAGNSWAVIPCHPLASDSIELLDYQPGMDNIDWDAMNRRDYHEDHSKSVCMAECLSPEIVSPDQFFKIFVPSDAAQKAVSQAAEESGVEIEVTVNTYMFVKKQLG